LLSHLMAEADFQQIFIYLYSKSWYAIIAKIVLNELDLIIDE